MSELLHLRQRIKTVRTTQKITHAMRLISMSQATRFKNQFKQYHHYSKMLESLYMPAEMCAQKAFHKHRLTNPVATGRTAHIIIGPQKGLCGNFLQSVVIHVLASVERTALNSSYLVIVGKKTTEAFERYNIVPSQRFDNLSATSLTSVSAALVDLIMNASPAFETVMVHSGTSRSFFLQVPTTTPLVPFTIPQAPSLQISEPILCDQTSESVAETYLNLMLNQKLTSLLLQSLSAEQAARFISMDQSIRNATQLLNDMQLSYNKLRQARITRELTDLAGGLEREIAG